jgi:hypothetical protein
VFVAQRIASQTLTPLTIDRIFHDKEFEFGR